MEKIKFTELQSLPTAQLNLSAIVPIVQGGENYQIALSSITTSVEEYDHSEVTATSGSWNSSYTTVNTNSASWDSHSDLTDLQAASGSWDSSYTTVNANSASWLNVNDQQTITTSSSALTLDVSLGESAVTTLTDHLTSFTISNAVSGDSGMIIVSSDGGGWAFPADVYPSLVMAGDLADVTTLTNSVSSRITIGWYYDGQFNYLYVSNAIT